MNSNSNIGDLLFNSGETFDFYRCSYMRYEIQNHWERLKKISKLSEEKLQISYTHVLSKFNFIHEEIIPLKTWLASEQLTKSIDIDDTDFVALTKFLRATLWTGDKALYNGLKKLAFRKVLNTNEYLNLDQ